MIRGEASGRGNDQENNSDLDEIDEGFSSLQAFRTQPITAARASVAATPQFAGEHSLSPLPRQPSTEPPTVVLPPAVIGRTHVTDDAELLIDVTVQSNSLDLLRAVWQSPLRWPTIGLVTLAVVSVAVWNRQLFDTATAPTVHPPLALSAMVIGRGVVTAVMQLFTHGFAGVGQAPERFVFEWPLVVLIGSTSFAAMLLAVYAASSLSWASAVILNPLAFAPLFALLLSPLQGSRVKRLPRSAALIVTVGILSLCIGVVRAVADHSMTIYDSALGSWSLGEGSACFLALASGLCLGLSMALMERYAIRYPSTPLYLGCATSFVEVVLLPLIIFVDAIPVVGSSDSLGASVERFFSLHRETLPSALVLLVAAHAAVHLVVFPVVTRAPALVVPIFAPGPLIAASVFPGPALPVLIGGLYCFLVAVLLLASDAEYDDDHMARMQTKTRLAKHTSWRCAVLWRHGSSVVCARHFRPLLFGMPAWKQRLLELLCIVGWCPLSSLLGGAVRYSASVIKSTHRDRYGYSVLRLSGLNPDD